ncbi:BTB/POZ domain-containing protein 19 isoform X1 [Rhea pennata]|uniref:BTB/POZ domain-containing protein 19 isoform X1 n=1 Tax=Rhea pennata TaxID=8795 RepID=UPI002E2759F8
MGRAAAGRPPPPPPLPPPPPAAAAAAGALLPPVSGLLRVPPARSRQRPMARSCSARLHGEAAAFTAALRSLVNNPQFSDVTFVVGQEKREVFAHRCVLACRCQAFQGMLSQVPAGGEGPPGSVPPQGPLVLGNVQPEVFLAVIEFLYTNCVTLNSHIALEVLTSSVEYGLQDLCKLCVEFLKETLSVEQVCEALQLPWVPLCPASVPSLGYPGGVSKTPWRSIIWRSCSKAAVTYGQADLQQHCLAFIEGCTAAVVRTRGFHELSDAALARVLRSDRLAVDELELVQAVREWAHVSSAVLERPVPEVAALPVRELRLPLLAPSELATLESHNRRDRLIPVESIAAAWRCHALRKGGGVPSRLCRPRRGTRPRDHHRHLHPRAK